MTVEAWTQTPEYTIAGIGPYAITHPYVAGAIRARVRLETGLVQDLISTEYSVTPEVSETLGNLFLSLSAAATHAGRKLIIDRVTPDEQGFLPVLGEREAGLAAQLDRMVQADQEIRTEVAGALRIRGVLNSFDLADGTVPIRDGDRIRSGPTAAQIEEAQSYATQAAAARDGAANSATQAALYDGPWLRDVAALLADVTLAYGPGASGVATGNIVRTRAEGFAYEAAASDATDHHVTTAGGVKLYVLPVGGGFDVRAFGAVGDGATDDTAAFQVAANAARAFHLAPGKIYRIAGTVNVANPLTIDGHGATITMSSNIAFNLTAPMEVYNVNFQSTATGTGRGYAAWSQSSNISGTKFVGCKLGRNQIVLRDADVFDGAAANRSIRIMDCTFSGDYTGIPGGDVNNIIDIRGAYDVYVTGCNFDVIGIERFVKISDSCRRVFIQGNSFKCNSTTVGKQAIDLFADTREVNVSDNIVDLTGFTAFCENKNGDGASDGYAEPSEVVVANNIIKMAGALISMTPIAIYGAWGLAEGTLSRATAKVAGNDILLTSTGATAANIVVRGMTHAEIARNTIWRDDAPTFAIGIEASNNKVQEVVGNQLEYGGILIGTARQHPGGTTYANQPEDTLVASNQVVAFGRLSGILVIGAAPAGRVTISGNTLVAKVGYGSSGVVEIEAATVAQLSVIGNNGQSLTNADILLTSSAAVLDSRVTANSWQSGRTAATPGTISAGSTFTVNVTVPGAQIGDTVQVGLPYDMQGANVEARVNASNNVRILIRNQTAGSLTFAAGTFAARTSRG